MMVNVIILMILLCCSGQTVAQSCLQVEGENISDHYVDRYERDDIEDITQEVLHRLADYTVIIVPGISLDLLYGMDETRSFGWLQRRFAKLYKKSGRWKDFQQFFSENGIRHQVLKTPNDVQWSFYHTGKVQALIELIQQTSGKIVILSQSKGGLDVMHALLRMKLQWKKFNNDLDRIQGLVFMQVPFQGLPIADLLYDVSFRQFGKQIHWIVRNIFGLHRETAKFLGFDFRSEYLSVFSDDFQGMLEQKGIISFSSLTNGERPNFQGKVLALIRKITLDRFGLDNDGLVPCGSSWPKSKKIIVPDVDHSQTILSSRRRRDRSLDYKKIPMIVSLLSLMFEDMDEKVSR